MKRWIKIWELYYIGKAKQTVGAVVTVGRAAESSWLPCHSPVSNKQMSLVAVASNIRKQSALSNNHVFLQLNREDATLGTRLQ